MNALAKYAAFAASALIVSIPSVAVAQSTEQGPPRWFVGLGATHLAFSEKSNINVGGSHVAGSSQRMSNNYAALIQLGYVLTPHIAVAVGVGSPATTTQTGTKSIAAAGVLGKTRYVPIVANLLYLLPAVGRVHPYVGAGASYSLVTHASDGYLQNFRVKDALGPELIAGFEVPVTKRVGVNAFYSKTFFNTKVNFNVPPSMGSFAGYNKLRLDPTVFSIGLSLHI